MTGTLALGPDQVELHRAAGRLLAERCPPAVPRSWLDGGDQAFPPFWDEIAQLGWLGIHLPGDYGGGGGGLADVAVVLEELGRALAPGPYLPTVLAAAVVDRLGSDGQRAAVLPDLAAGTAVGAVALSGTGDLGDDGRLSGRWPLVPCAACATVLVLPVGDSWVLADRDDVVVTPRPSVDETRPVADIAADAVAAAPERIFADASDDTGTSLVERLAVRLLAAEAIGVAAWCVATAAEHAKVREQFGRPIGQFQAVKHRCADMFCLLELARAASWDAARADDQLADAAAAALGPEAALRTAEGCVQVLGGIGFTWEHDVHLYLKRAMATRAVLGTPGRWRATALTHAREGRRREMLVDLPAEADTQRREVRAFLDDLQQQDKSTWRASMADAGYLAPHWPRPWGRGAGALEQLVVDEEFQVAGVRRPHLQVAAWALPTLIAHGDADQQARWIPPTLRGEVTWCQLFSEPGAGSDLASLTTKAHRVEGGWQLTGQKVWTTLAAQSDVGLCLARTDPDAPRHDGITCFVVDMRAPGVDIRPLRELTGYALFNEVFLTDVFVPDQEVVGPVGGGWRAARTTLGNERVSMSTGSSFGLGEEALLTLLGDDPVDDRDDNPVDDPVAADEVGRLLVEAHALAVLRLRLTLRAISTEANADSEATGAEASVRKLLGAEHDQKVQEAGWTLLGRAGTSSAGPAASWVAGYLANRCLTIAGGTSEIQRNVIAERLLGLPRDP